MELAILYLIIFFGETNGIIDYGLYKFQFFMLRVEHLYLKTRVNIIKKKKTNKQMSNGYIS